jgi:hypothetical protein
MTASRVYHANGSLDVMSQRSEYSIILVLVKETCVILLFVPSLWRSHIECHYHLREKNENINDFFNILLFSNDHSIQNRRDISLSRFVCYLTQRRNDFSVRFFNKKVMPSKKILFVLTSHDQFGNGDPTGWYLPEVKIFVFLHS